MAKMSDIKGILRSLDCEIGRKKKGCYPVVYRQVELKLKAEDVDNYLAAKDSIKTSFETEIHHPGYLERVVEIQGRDAFFWRRRSRDEGIILVNHAGDRTISLSNISPVFALFLLDKDSFPEELKRFFSIGFVGIRHRNARSDESPNFFDLFRNIVTVKVVTKPDDKIAEQNKQLRSIAEAALFHIAYGYGVGINFASGWERVSFRLGIRTPENVQFPLRTYNSELLAYYHLAFGSESQILAYLALYKILEYFFTSSSEHTLHEKIKGHLVIPEFSHTKPKQLRELVQIVRRHDNKMDESKMLKIVLERYFDKGDLRDWIVKYEEEHGQYFTEEKVIFAASQKIDTSDNQLVPTISKRIYHIRNTLVHHKEGEISRFIPFSGQEKILYKELPLILHIAEQLIVKTGNDIKQS